MKRGVGGAVQSFSAYMAQPGEVLAYEAHGATQRVVVDSVVIDGSVVTLVGTDGVRHTLEVLDRVHLMPHP